MEAEPSDGLLALYLGYGPPSPERAADSPWSSRFKRSSLDIGRFWLRPQQPKKPYMQRVTTQGGGGCRDTVRLPVKECKAELQDTHRSRMINSSHRNTTLYNLDSQDQVGFGSPMSLNPNGTDPRPLSPQPCALNPHRETPNPKSSPEEAPCRSPCTSCR